MTKKVFIIAGEASGDLHASRLVEELVKKDTELTFYGWGGDKMEEEGVSLKKHYKELAFMGFVEVLLNIRTILRNFKLCKQQIADIQPDVVLLVDYPGFNLRMAKWCKQQGYKVLYYISPTVWAWKESRVEIIRKYVDELIVILPFEPDFYKKHQMEVHYFGNPLLDAVDRYRKEGKIRSAAFFGLEKDRPIVSLLPGSRKQEVKVKLPVMLEAMRAFPEYQVIIAGAPGLDLAFYQEVAGSDVSVVFGETYNLITLSELALVTSGTATLETAILGTPQVVCYKGSSISYHIAKRLVNIKYISLVNLILDRPAVTELIQYDCTVPNLIREVEYIKVGGIRREKVLKDYEELRMILGSEAVSEKIAQYLLKTIDTPCE